MPINGVSEYQCRQMVINREYYGNTMNVSDEMYHQILAEYSDKIGSWRNAAVQDKTEYQISDEEQQEAQNKGKEEAKDATGYKGGKKWGSVLSAVGAAGTVATTLGKEKIGSWMATESTKGIAKKLGANKAVVNATNKCKDTKAASKQLGDIATVLLASANVAKYLAQKPNKEQTEALIVMRDQELPDSYGKLTESQTAMDEANQEIQTRTEECEEKVEETQSEIDETKMNYDMSASSRKQIVAKANSKQGLTAGDKALYKESTKEMTDAGEKIQGLQDETSEVLDENLGIIGDQQAVFDDSAEKMGIAQGKIEYAEGFDKQTKIMTQVEALSQGVNATTAGIAATKLSLRAGITFGVSTAFAAIGFAAAAASTKFALKQNDYTKEISGEIDMRKQTTGNLETTADMYDESLDNFDASISYVEEDLELAVPDDIEAPEENINIDGEKTTSGSLMQIAQDKKEKDEKDKENKNK